MTDSLNLDHHTLVLCLKALNKHRRALEASMALGVSKRTLHRHIKRYGIRYHRRTKTWSIKTD